MCGTCVNDYTVKQSKYVSRERMERHGDSLSKRRGCFVCVGEGASKRPRVVGRLLSTTAVRTVYMTTSSMNQSDK